MSNFNHGVKSYGVPLFPTIYGRMITGNTFFADSGNSNAGTDSDGAKNRPLSKMDGAVGKCTSAAGDAIVVEPGHTETVTSAGLLALDVQGITLFGVGVGDDRPTINFTTATTASMTVGAANITMINFLFTGNIDALVNPIDVNAADFNLINCEWRDETGQATDVIVTDANADRMRIYGYRHTGASAAGASSAIKIVGGDDIVIDDFMIDGNFSTACINNDTTDWTDIEIGNGMLRNRAASTAAISGNSNTASGWIGKDSLKIRLNGGDIGTAFENTGGMQFSQPIGVCTADGRATDLVPLGKLVGVGLGDGN